MAAADSLNVKAIMDRNGGAGPGFGALRLSLALAVLFVHSLTVAQYDVGLPQRVWSGPLRPVLLAILPMFFALSGFLIAGSALRLRTLKAFLVSRLLRLLPALIVEVTLSALILGPLLTSVTWRSYFSDPLFLSYFGNILGHVQFNLPGLFADAPMPSVVNLNLWTLAPEYDCYLLMTALMASGVLFDGYKTTLVATVVLGLVGIGNSAFDLAETDTTYGAPILLASFTMGAVAYHWRERIFINGEIFVAASAVLYSAWSFRGAALLGLMPMTYCMVYLGMQRFPRLQFVPEGDYSYGIYLFGFPLQQTLVFLFPALKVWWALFPIAALTTCAAAIASWHLVEQPALSLRSVLIRRRETTARRPIPLGPDHAR